MGNKRTPKSFDLVKIRTQNRREKHIQLCNSALYNCKHILHGCLFEYEQSRPGVRLEKRKTRVAISKQQGGKIHSDPEQRRSQLQKHTAALCEWLADYEVSSPAGVRLECRTPSVGRYKETGE